MSYDIPHGNARDARPTGASAQTQCLHSGRTGRDGDPLVPPIFASTTFCREGIDSRAEHRYSRESNPTVSALEATLAALEGAAGTVAFGTGLAAETALFTTCLTAGDHVICSRDLYGGTTRLLEKIWARFGVETTFVDTTDLASVEQAFRANTKLLFLETPSNPTLRVTDIRRASELARAHGALVAVDNTFLTPVLQKPLDLGADISVLSTTKICEGHSVALGGALSVRDEELLEELRMTRKCTGAIQSPFGAWLTWNGLRTLPLRLRAQSETAARLAQWLDEQPFTEEVHYPGLNGEHAAEAAESQHLGAHGAVLSFELRGGLEAAKSALAKVELCRLVEHVGSVETLLTHSASMTHGSLTPSQRAAAGIPEGLLRLSVGLEPFGEIQADLDRAFACSGTSPTVREEVTL